MERLKQRFHSSTLAVKQRGRGAMTLHECLQAVGLQHHYASFTSMGVCRAAHLSALTMEDYPLLGIHTMEDRTRLFHLVQMVKKMVMCEDDDDYDDEGCAVVSSRYSYSRDPGEDICVGDDSSANVNNITADGFARASSVRRRLDFSCETSDLHQRLRTSPKGPVHKYTSHNRGKNPLYTSHTRLSHQCESLHKQTPRLATKTFNNIPAGPKHRKRISRPCEERGRSGASRHIVKPTPVYESARPAGYNYGLPQSSPAVIKRQAGDQRISVCVRKRPLMHAESRREADVVTTPGGDCVIIHESKEAVDLTQYILQHRFYFDQVFGEGSSNEDVYRRTAYPLVQHMLSGGKATCFAYGQTGAGKTHTMLGSSPTSPGLYALAVRDIFAHLSTAHTLSPILVYVSFFEIYCGQLYDLLDHRKRVFAREDGQRVVHIAGLREVRVDSVSSLLEVISHGLGERTQGMSGVNPLSSRSHALLQIQLRNKKQQIAGRMWFVDLAGSERASDTKEPDRQSRMEGAEINQSLLALKECIRSLNQEQSHTPFRQSKLTQVLKDSFVGNSMTCMIANISPGHLATEHTLNTLRYADRVKELKRQGEVRGGRRAKTVPCPRLNSSNSSSSTVVTRGKSPPKKAKLWQKETPGTISRTAGSPIGEAILCSTPKTSRWGEETSQQGSKGVGFEHITPVRGWVGTADRRERVKTLDKQGVREIEHERTDSHVVRCRAEPVLGQPCREGHLSTAQRERVFSQRETVKVGREEKRKLIEPQKQTDISTGREAERQNDKVLKNADKKNNEKQRHLRWYHQQLQQFIPSPASLSSPSFSSSNETSLSSTVSPTSCSFQPSRLSLSALMCHGLEEVLEKYRNQPETSLHVTNDNEDARGDFGSVGEDWTLLWEETKAKVEQHMDESEKSRPVKARSEVRAKQENKGTAGIVGRERRWAWVATGTQHADRMTGAVLNTVEAQASYNCVSEDRSGADEEGLSASHVPAEQGGSSSVSAHRNSLVNTFPLESPHLRAPAERPFSPGCEHAKTHPVPNKLSDVCFELKHTGCTSSIRHREKDQGVTTNVNRRHFPNAQSSTQLLNTSIAQTQCQKTARPLFHVKLKTVLPQDKTCGHSLSYTVDPLSIPWLQVDQAVGTVSCLQGEQNNASVCLQKNNRGEDNPRKVGNPTCLDMLGTIVENELRQSWIQWPLTSDTALNYNERRQAMCCATYENCETGSEERQTPEALLISLQDQGSPQKPPDQVTEVPAPTLSSFAFASMQASVKQRIKASAQYTRNTDSSNSHSLTHNMSSIKTQLPESGHLNVVSSQSDTAHSLRIRDSDNLLKMNSPTESNGQESICSQQVRPTNQRSTLENVNHTQWCVVRAHWEQLEEMEALCHTEGMLLCQQPDMDFNEYIHKLEKIMERKAQCVHSMRSQLQPYLTPNHSSQSHDEGEYNTNINSVI